ncbi:hypothetical protein RNJ44_02151 [Nakaseomyces bracarensis]|uniref:Electron transfer flavoprotein-ubiquinone oxidoreductase n=1 Tax=Nakaseomyces bracarensis TaxID=273131 RepID=A0ABR4NMS9_9SACH
MLRRVSVLRRPLPRLLSVYRAHNRVLYKNTSVPSLVFATRGISTSNVQNYASEETSFKNLPKEDQAILTEERAVDNVDVCIVGGGPAGLATAIKLKQLDNEKGNGSLRVVVLEKASDMGLHIVSGAILEPKIWRELFPESEFYEEDGSGIPLPKDIATKVTHGQLKYLLNGKLSVPVPEPPAMVNEGNYIVSLNRVVQHLAEKAEEIGVEIYPGIAVSDVIYDTSGENVIGVASKDLGISKKGKPKATFERGMEFHARQTVFAEGCRGSLTKEIIDKYNLRNGRQNQTYGLGIKEVWEVKPENFKKGYASHTMGYPLPNDVYGGGFMYHFGDGLVAVGLVVGLDYKNPYVSPYKEFQKMKHHPYYANVLEGGKCISYAARALNEGGLQAIPKLNFPGGALVGASAGFMNVPKIKGTHTAMKSGMLAAENIFDAIKERTPIEEVEDLSSEEVIDLKNYNESVKNSWIYEELHKVRNIRPSFTSKLGGYAGMVYSSLDSYILRGHTPWTFSFHKSDASVTGDARNFKPINYPKPDGKLSFDIMTSVSRTGTYHDEDEKCHLRVPNQDLAAYALKTYPKYKGVEERFCPAGVYEFVEDSTSPIGVKFQINSQNCIHCKTCDIKAPTEEINWVVPEGGDGPKYTMT